MIEVEVIHRDPIQERRTFAPEPPAGARVIEGNALLRDATSGALVGIQAHLTSRPWIRDLTRSLAAVKWDGGAKASTSAPRLGGFANSSRTFGSLSPVPLRRRYGCSEASFDRDYPGTRALLGTFADAAWGLFREHVPEQATDHAERVEGIDPSWLLGATPWTSGIVNCTSSLPYHRDAGNVKGSWSAMLGLRRDTRGGLLHLAEYDVWLPVEHGSVSIFDGQGVLHGVSPIERDGPRPQRYTIVLYARAGCRSCLAGTDELHRTQRLRSEAEQREADRRA